MCDCTICLAHEAAATPAVVATLTESPELVAAEEAVKAAEDELHVVEANEAK